MTLARFVRKNVYRNKLRFWLTVGSMAFSLALLSFLMSMWQAFYGNNLRSEQSAQRLIVRHKVSLTNLIPSSYREKIRHVPGVMKVIPMNWFGGTYKDNRNPKNQFARFSTEPEKLFRLYTEWSIPEDQKVQPANFGWWWIRPWFEHQNLRDDRVEAFTSLLWEGVYSYTYVARATTPGSFVVPPPKAEEMYHPETFGRGATDRVVVE